MSLSTLLEAAKYLDYLDSNPQQGQLTQQQQNYPADPSLQQQQQQQSQLNQHFQKAQATSAKRSARRQRSSKKDAANTMLAMSLPASTGTIQMQHSVPIPLASGSGVHGHHHASLSSSFTTESPLSSFASTALLCSKASGVTSASSSAASSLSSSDSSSSCGEILMGDTDFNQSTPANKRTTSQKHKTSNLNHTHQQISNNNIGISNNQHNLYQTSLARNQPTMMSNFSHGSHNDRGHSFARYIAATSSGPQLVTMTATASGGMTSASAPIDGRIRAGHVIHAATQNSNVGNSTAVTFEQHAQFAMGGLHGRDNQTAFGIAASPVGSENLLGSSPGSCPPLVMARVQPMILNSISPSAHQSLMAFQPAHGMASSPTSSSSSYSRHRELHKTLEKNRRAHLRHCFELLKSELPFADCTDKKTSHINIIKSAIRYVLALRQQECEIDNELQRLTRIKNDLTEKLTIMRNNGDQSQLDSKHQLIEPSPKSKATVKTSNQLPSNPDANLSSYSPPSDQSSPHVMKQHEQSSPQQPVAEQQLSFLLSQSKID